MNANSRRLAHERLLAVIILSFAPALFAQNRPFPTRAYYPGATLKLSVDEAQQNQDVRAFYDHWKNRYLVAAGTSSDGTPRWRVAMGVGSNRATSESMGYGMTIVALMAGHEANAQAIFNGLSKFVDDFPSNSGSGLMSWEVTYNATDGTYTGGSSSAFDGDVDIAYALLLADKQWGSAGSVNYLQKAQQRIAAIKAETIGSASFLPMLGDWVSLSPTATSRYNQWAPRTSDFMLANFRAFGTATGDSTWSTVVSRSHTAINHLQTNYAPQTGLLPDFTKKTSSTDTNPSPADPYHLEQEHDGKYYYNAARVPWRLGLDAVLHNDSSTLTQVRKISTWAEGKVFGNPQALKPGYELDGDPIHPTWGFDPVFAAPLGVAALTGDPGDATDQQWLDSLYNAVRTPSGGYYQNSLALISLLIMTRTHWDASSDMTAPAINVLYPAPNSTITGELSEISGVASDGGSGIQKVEIRFYRPRPGAPGYWDFWNGTSWHWSDPLLQTTLDTSVNPNTWRRNWGLPTGANFPPGTYYVQAFSYDKAGNQSAPMWMHFYKQ